MQSYPFQYGNFPPGRQGFWPNTYGQQQPLIFPNLGIPGLGLGSFNGNSQSDSYDSAEDSSKGYKMNTKSSRLKRKFDPHRDRHDYSYVADPKQRRRLRSIDNARLYRDREKQYIIDLQNKNEELTKSVSAFKCENALIADKMRLLESYIQNRKDANIPMPESEERQEARKQSTDILGEALNMIGTELDDQGMYFNETQVEEFSHIQETTTYSEPPTLPGDYVSNSMIAAMDEKYREQVREHHLKNNLSNNTDSTLKNSTLSSRKNTLNLSLNLKN
jgi:hypothetical protein